MAACLGGTRDLRQRDITVMSPVVIGTNLALHIVVGEHRVVQGDAGFWSVALSLVLVVVNTIYIYDALVVLSRVPIYLN